MSRISQALRVRAGGKGAPASEPAESPLDQYDCEEQVADIAEFHPRDAEPMAAPPPGATPPVRVRSNRRSPGDDTEARLVTGTSSTVSIEQYRRLAAMLHEEQVDSGLKVVMLTSALPGEGKTLTAVNVGLTLSESYARRVLIIDADLRVPSVHATFGVPNGRGLSDAIRGEAPLSFTEVSNGLSLLTAGAPGATPLAGLTSPRMKAILEECASRFDWVLIDTPPIGVLPDAQVLARLSGAVIFVVGAGSTPAATVERAIAELGGPDAVFGVVLNRVEERRVPDSGYYGHYQSARKKSQDS